MPTLKWRNVLPAGVYYSDMCLVRAFSGLTRGRRKKALCGCAGDSGRGYEYAAGGGPGIFVRNGLERCRRHAERRSIVTDADNGDHTGRQIFTNLHDLRW